MTTDPEFLEADPADVAEQQEDLVPPVEDPEAPDLQPGEAPLEADEADVAEQWTEVPDEDDDVDEI
jgi:hypothetical protein